MFTSMYACACLAAARARHAAAALLLHHSDLLLELGEPRFGVGNLRFVNPRNLGVGDGGCDEADVVERQRSVECGRGLATLLSTRFSRGAQVGKRRASHPHVVALRAGGGHTGVN
eukprot:5833294-Pleurochrysis_carterae.AAC.2